MKKGQIYILTALILIVIIYGMITVVNKASQENIESDFEKLSNNYASEGAKLINDVKGQDGQELIISTFRNYTRSFTSYSKTQSTEFGLIYAFYYTGADKTKGRVYIGNYLNMPMLVSYDDNTYTFLEGCYSEIPAGVSFDGIKLNMDLSGNAKLGNCEKVIPPETQQEVGISKLYLTIGGYGYTFDIMPGQIQLIIVSREDYPEQRKVFVGGAVTNTEQEATLFSDYCQRGAGGAGCSGNNPQCSVDYLTKDDCNQDPKCRWDERDDICAARA